MIQRIQSIFLLLAGTASVMVLFLPIWSNEVVGQYSVSADTLLVKMSDSAGNVLKTEPVAYVAVLAAICAIITFYTIFRFKTRKIQIKMGWLCILLNCGLVVAFAYSISRGQLLLGVDEAGSFKVGFFMPFVSMIFVFMANHYIRKDERLVRSVDRLR